MFPCGPFESCYSLHGAHGSCASSVKDDKGWMRSKVDEFVHLPHINTGGFKWFCCSVYLIDCMALKIVVCNIGVVTVYKERILPPIIITAWTVYMMSQLHTIVMTALTVFMTY